MPNYHNHYLFSEAYLIELTNIEDASASRASMTSMSEFLIYADQATLSQWNKSFVHECLQSLGFRTEKKSDNLALLKQHGEDDSPIGVCISALPSANLDNTLMGNNYAFEVISALNNSGLKWGIVTNGNIWRIYHTDESIPYENYLEIDLQQILASKDLSSFQLLFFFLKAENFVVKDGQCRFDIFKTESQNKIAYIEDELKKSLKPKDEGGQGVLSDISYGYVEYLRSKGTSDFSDDKIRETIYGGALFYMFRLLFIFYAQARELLHELELQELEFILEKIRENKDNNTARKDNFELWHSFNRIFSEINDIYNGGLFNPEENDFTKFIDDNRIADCYLSEALFNLLHYTEKNKEIKPISYRDMNVRHLGTLYEGLLEHKLFVAEEDTEVRIVKKVIEFIPQSQGGKIITGKYIPAGQVYFGNDKGTRKASGSYYTPEYIVEYIVTNTVDEKLKELETRFDESITTYKNDLKLALNDSEKQGIGLLIKQDLVAFVEKEVLNFYVLDPAMGSGHFLVNATNHISNFITRFMNGYFIDAYDTDTGTNFWRRRVVENCIHGVDLSMLASELAKLSLWIMTMSKDKPLSFLNHNLKIGNSLIGSRLADLGKYPLNKIDHEHEDLFTKDEYFQETLQSTLLEFELLKVIGSENKKDIQEKQRHLETINELIIPYKAFCNLHTSVYFGNDISKENYDEIISKQLPHSEKTNSSWFHWDMEFPLQIISKGGFDCIIGNPPWGANFSQFEKDYCKINYSNVHVRSVDSLNYFISRSLSIINKNGYISFITPNNLLFQNEYEKTRLLLISQNRITKICNLGDGVFDGVDMPSSILTLQSKILSDYQFSYQDLRAEKEKTTFINSHLNIEESSKKEILEIPSFVFGINKASLDILNKIEAHSFLIDDIVAEVACGISSGGDKIFRVSEEIVIEQDLEKDLLRKVLVGNEVSKYFIVDTLHYIIYSHRSTKIDDYPNIKSYLENKRDLLSKRSETKQGILPWYSLNRSRFSQLFEEDKIVLRQTSDTIIASIDNEHYYSLDSLLIIKLNLNHNYTYRYILGILNSSVTNFTYKNLTQEADRNFAQVKPKNVRKLFIPNLSQGDISKIESTVDVIIKSKKNDPQVNINEYTEFIENMLYDFYGFSEKEINIIKTLNQ